MMKIAICDDNENTLKLLCEIVNQSLESINQEFMLDKFKDGIELLDENRYKLYDIIFLDIDMPEVSGFDIAKDIYNDCNNKFVVFITNYAEYMAESFEYHPFYFIIKSDAQILRQAISNTLKKIAKRILQNEVIVFDDSISRKQQVRVCDIMYMEVNRHYIHYYVRNEPDKFIVRESMKTCEEKYSLYGFVRTQKKYLVNLQHIDYVDLKKDEIKLYNGQKLAMSRNYKKVVDEKHTEYLRTKV